MVRQGKEYGLDKKKKEWKYGDDVITWLCNRLGILLGWKWFKQRQYKILLK